MSHYDPNEPILSAQVFEQSAPPPRAATPRPPGSGDSQTAALEKVAMAFLAEQRRARRWRIFFRLATLAIIVLFISVGFMGKKYSSNCLKECTALVQLNGTIALDADASAENIISGLKEAFTAKHVRGVVLEINSPGGSPVQAGQIYDEIKRLRAAHPHIPLYAVVGEMAASGGYYVAAAADEIYVDKASLVGSIGVIMMNFGFTEAIQKLGIEQRTMTAGDNKAFMDPFSPVNETQKEHVQKLLDSVHQQFITAVRNGRGTRLNETPEMFSGLIWNGNEAVTLGLADGLGSVNSVARDVIGVENIYDFTYRPDFSERLARQLGAAFAEQVATKLGSGVLRWK
ncbi:MAG: signal peptide peptidase SppA [Proteobacteria bacterium]|nr:signal peptide peptidase SppA [Pseudomonadota bacterium]MCL2308387.1 signal peptide peptidase SppA [Pseudomonadota bacterium]